ncbi:alkanesulfonate monooxygenase SsuD/methylene tetrahydromethanopterin reductase-like flavin-dependent oxidoreductase (luciferase family) [Amycolatopsis bartoniae]|uniref:Luciferase n=1 Tax=Amycolatopsis bartoniae TaxID=941986 RepID=A0A8H9J1N4_9PSEU|nr:LLM class flavin-dependent oxidoreductase [Amycolatopsis bartoniae]MBB2939053.1 alkanesulfonate monooxygenase SsuD/methylene tetrahydromethanopterin reductase-like flavin-dependent oxidoreductase (luciferase family) [Amycolatopsis bartoniae]TVT06316.1 LLM class flavin-dependent oxidoreductase [Amycolatopsis bartoniae]GHF65283.1 luciferase [Amycolatopsis bartoniae]
MRFAISIPQFSADGEFDPVAFRAYLRRAEELGFHSGWTQEQFFGTLPTIAPLQAMTYAAACTETLRLGCSVFVTPLHNPVHLAKALSSLDQLSLGRIEVGIGTGGRARPFPAFGVTGEAIVARFLEGLQVMRALWTEPEVTFDGRFWQLEGAPMEPKPFQKPGPPVWFGGSHPNALRRAVRHGDGFFGAGSTTTEKFAEQVRIVRQERADFPIAKRIYIAVDDDGDRAREQIAAGLAAIYGRRGLESVAVAGTPAECVRGVQEVADAGAELILFTTVFEQAEQLERLAAEVVPHIS